MFLTNRQLFLKYVALPAEEENAPEIVKASGIYLFDVDGNRYVDLVSGVSVSNIGHGHPKVVQAVKDQAETYMHLMVYGKYIQSPQVRLAQKIAENLPGNLQSVFFVNSGSEAIEGALKLAKRITGRTELIACKDAYHGSTHGALSMLGNEEMKYAYRPLLSDIRFINFNSFPDLDQISETTAAVLIEPVQAEAGILLPENGFLEALRKKCDETGCMLIFDEVQMGFGRTGKLFAMENFDCVPDIICLAKAMGGGMPLGAFISSAEHMNKLTYNPALGHITTFGGHPVSCAASLAGLEVILEEKLAEQAAKKGKMFKDLISGNSAVQEIRQIGLMLGIELKDKSKLPQLMKLFKQNRLIVDQFLFNDSSFRIAPPLTISYEEIESVAGQVNLSLAELL